MYCMPGSSSDLRVTISVYTDCTVFNYYVIMNSKKVEKYLCQENYMNFMFNVEYISMYV